VFWRVLASWLPSHRTCRTHYAKSRPRHANK
jgi:hypothetical protein